MNALRKKFRKAWMILLVISILILIYLNTLYPWMNGWGLTATQAAMALPGDGTEPGTIITSTRGVIVNAPASVVWQWVVQLGQERAGFYSNDWLENLVLSDIHNGNEHRPEWQQRQTGDSVLGAGGVVFGQSFHWNIKAYEAGKMLYLWGPIVVLPVNDHASLLITRSYAQPSPLTMQLTYDWMHFVMEKGMLLGIKARAEGKLQEDAFWRFLSQIGWIFSTMGMAVVLFGRKRGWGWGLLPLAYAAAIVVFTGDIWATMAAFLWWGVIAAGFLVFGRGWWKGLSLVTVAVVYIYVLAPQPQIAFGILFLVITLGILAIRFSPKKQPLRIKGAAQQQA